MTQLSDDDVPDTGDLGRRILERQEELNLTVVQVAESAGTAANYLEYRLALALDMPSSAFRGGQQSRAQGRLGAAPDPHLVTMNEKECEDYLAEGGVGRVIFRSAGRPVALPVNFKTLAGDIIFRSGDDGEVSAISGEEPVSFEVDRIDDAMREGWSVLATGTVRPVSADEQIHEVQALGVEPWAGGKSAHVLLHQCHQAHRQEDQHGPVKASVRCRVRLTVGRLDDRSNGRSTHTEIS
jgi:hypothetical protein